MTADVIDIRSAAGPRRAMPHNLSNEASILGAVIWRNEALADLAELETDDFYDGKHRVVFQAIRNLQHADRPIDVVTLEDEIEKQGKLEAIGGIAFLGELTLNVPTPDNVIAYRDTVRTLSRNRKAIVELSSGLERAWSYPHDPGELISDIAGRLGRIDLLGAPPAKRLKLITVGQAMEDLAALAKAPVYPTPFPTLNDNIGFGGLLGTQVYTVAAGTGRGKTTFVAGVGCHAAQTVPVIVASYEMKPGYFVARKAASVLGIHSNEIIRGTADMGAVLRAMPYSTLWLMHKPSLTDLRTAVDWVSQKYGAAPLVIVDYIQKLADEIALGQQRPDLRIATSQASATLLDIGDRSGAAIIAVSAIGRGKRALSTPRKFEPYELVEVAKESGAVEYDGAAMIVLSLSKEFDNGERIGTITLAKARFGQECHIDARYQGARGLWRDVGLVEDVEAPSKPLSEKAAAAAPKEEREDVIRRKVIDELQRSPARTKRSLIDRIHGARKETIRPIVARMLDEGVLQEIPNAGITLSPTGRQLTLTEPPK